MATVQEVVRAVDGLLKLHGFNRRGKTWTRELGDLHGVVNVQVGKGGDTVTLNVGVYDRECDWLCWG